MIAPISNIICGTRIREVSPDTVSALAASMSEVGLLNPITVSKTTVVRGGRAQDGYMLIGGLHRLEAAKRLGWTDIAVTVTDLTGDWAVIAECDENLCGTNLSLAERAIFTLRRKEAYERAHPETHHGGDHGNQYTGGMASRQIGDLPLGRFTADTAAKTGHSERNVQRDARRGKRIEPDVLASIAGTKLDTSKVLDELAATPKEKQRERVGDIAKRKSAKPTPAPATKEKWIAEGMRWWNRGNKDWQEEFRKRIEAPVFDRRRTA